ncbi:MAG TPA: rhomboid family intramembrane serine protease [Gemmataceae bacterium]|jgi:rhomboid protease GluP
MSESGLNPLESILRLCAASAPEPWYPRLYAKQSGVNAQALGLCLEELWLSGLIEKSPGNDETGPAISLTREGERVLLDPEALGRLRAGEALSPNDRAGLIRQALSGGLRPLVTVLLVLLNVVVFAVGYFNARAVHADNAFLSGDQTVAAVLTILDRSGALSASHLIDGEWWRLVTAAFVHVGFLHLLLNMVFLYLAGRYAELMWGHLRYLVIYFAGVLGGSCLAAAHNGSGAGASAAVYGLIAAEAVWFLFNRRYLPRALLRQARTSFVITLVLVVFTSSFKDVSGWGHFGGAVAGALAALLMHLHRFGPPLWRWLALTGFLPMVWYGDYVVEQARATDPVWLQAEDRHFEARCARPVNASMKKAEDVYFHEIQPLLEIHPTRRDAAEVQAALPLVVEQQRELTALADRLARAGPYHSEEAETARAAGRQYVLAGIELFNQAEHHLQVGDKRTDEDRKALREKEQEVAERGQEWRELFK